MSCITTISSIAASLWLASSGEAEVKTLVIGTEDTFPPYVIRGENGTLSGFDIEMMGQICTRTGYDCTFEVAAFNELIPGVAEGRFDLVLGGMAITPERRAVVDFSIPYQATSDTEWFIGFPDARPPETARIAVEAGTMHETWLRNEGLDFQSYPSEQRTLEAVADGRADLALGPFAFRDDLDALITGKGMDYLYTAEIPDEGTGIAICKGNPLKAEIDRALEAMIADGTLNQLDLRWF